MDEYKKVKEKFIINNNQLIINKKIFRNQEFDIHKISNLHLRMASINFAYNNKRYSYIIIRTGKRLDLFEKLHAIRNNIEIKHCKEYYVTPVYGLLSTGLLNTYHDTGVVIALFDNCIYIHNIKINFKDIVKIRWKTKTQIKERLRATGGDMLGIFSRRVNDNYKIKKGNLSIEYMSDNLKNEIAFTSMNIEIIAKTISKHYNTFKEDPVYNNYNLLINKLKEYKMLLDKEEEEYYNYKNKILPNI